MNDPFARLPVVPRFTVTSTDVTGGQVLPPAQMSGIFEVAGGEDLSPQLSWSGAPCGNRELHRDHVRPRCPSGSGFGHWAIADLPASVTGLPTGARDGTGENLPAGALHLPNDARLARFIGAGPPPGDGRRRCVIVVQAIGIEKVGQLQLQLRVQADSTPAWLGFSAHYGARRLRSVERLLGRIRPVLALVCAAPSCRCDVGQVRAPHQRTAGYSPAMVTCAGCSTVNLWRIVAACPPSS
jgi:Raf kinase inhibitor-like YbhB/YbcL family protein